MTTKIHSELFPLGWFSYLIHPTLTEERHPIGGGARRHERDMICLSGGGDDWLGVRHP